MIVNNLLFIYEVTSFKLSDMYDKPIDPNIEKLLSKSITNINIRV
jgi:hypothetical protein